MGAMIVKGKVVGATDGASRSFAPCLRNNLRGKIGCDQGIPDSDVLDQVDSMFAQKVIAALAAKLEPDDLKRCLGILVAADLVTSEEEQAVISGMEPEEPDEPDEPDVVAIDAAMKRIFPHSDRLKSGGLGFDSKGGSARRSAVAQTAAQDADHLKMFPHANRLK